MRKRRQRIYVWEEDARIFKSKAKLLGMSQSDFFKEFTRSEQKKLMNGGFKLEL